MSSERERCASGTTLREMRLMPKPKPKLLAYSVESLREAIRGRASVPGNMLQEALCVIQENMHAMETKFFTFQGMVTDKRDIPALGVRNDAAKLVLAMSDLLARPQPIPRPPKMEIFIDPKTGAMKLTIGDDSIESDQPEVFPVPHVPMLDPAMLADAERVANEFRAEEAIGPQVQGESFDDEEPEHIKVKKGELPSDVRAALFGPQGPQAQPADPSTQGSTQ